MTLFNVTYEIVTPDSAEHGDAVERGFIAQGVTFREAVKLVLETRRSRVAGVECVEANTSDPYGASWITVYNGLEFETAAQESRSIHLPDSLTPSTRRRIADILQVY